MVQLPHLILFFAVNSTAADYEAVNETVTFSPCENRQCVNVNINGLIDEEEWVSLSLTKSLTTPSFIALNQDLTTALMFITNECKLQLFRE